MKYIECKFSVWEKLEVQTIITGYHVKSDQVELFESGLLVVEKGYAWDGATGAVDSKSIIFASCIHDILCGFINSGLLPVFVQALADEQFRLIEQQGKMPWIRRMWTYLGVRTYQINKKPGLQREILEVAHG